MTEISVGRTPLARRERLEAELDGGPGPHAIRMLVAMLAPRRAATSPLRLMTVSCGEVREQVV
ncbi:hypothetical protein [Umezawaea sp.]|uniref:hypothetical protein n=1 Tax=Umezawaea sp. TaxID=1955258 RepID=UPI002ED52202